MKIGKSQWPHLHKTCQNIACKTVVQSTPLRSQVVKAPGNLVISAYVTCPDITLTVTPDLKLPGEGYLLHVDLGREKRRLGGSALAHAYGQVSLYPPSLTYLMDNLFMHDS